MYDDKPEGARLYDHNEALRSLTMYVRLVPVNKTSVVSLRRVGVKPEVSRIEDPNNDIPTAVSFLTTSKNLKQDYGSSRTHSCYSYLEYSGDTAFNTFVL